MYYMATLCTVSPLLSVHISDPWAKSVPGTDGDHCPRFLHLHCLLVLYSLCPLQASRAGVADEVMPMPVEANAPASKSTGTDSTASLCTNVKFVCCLALLPMYNGQTTWVT